MNTLSCTKLYNYTTTKLHHHTDRYEIELYVNGSETAVIGSNTYSFGKNDIVVIPPGVKHQQFPDQPFFAISLLAKNLPFSDVTIVRDNDNSIYTLFLLLHRVLTEKEKNYTSIADTLTDAISLFIKRNMKYRYTFTVDLQEKLYKNISNCDFSISDEILSMGFNLDYFRRCFKEDFNMTPHTYMTNMRIDFAKKALRNNALLSIEKISYMSGFNDSFYFSKIFKKHTGLTPRDYRQKHSEQ